MQFCYIPGASASFSAGLPFVWGDGDKMARPELQEFVMDPMAIFCSGHAPLVSACRLSACGLGRDKFAAAEESRGKDSHPRNCHSGVLRYNKVAPTC